MWEFLWSNQKVSSSAAGGSHILVRQLKEHSWMWPQDVCKHKGKHFSSSCPLWRSLCSLWPSFFRVKPYHAARWSSNPHVRSGLLSSLSLSLSGDSLTILCRRSNPDLQGSLPGAPFNCLVQAAASRGWNDSGSQVFHSFVFTSF